MYIFQIQNTPSPKHWHPNNHSYWAVVLKKPWIHNQAITSTVVHTMINDESNFEDTILLMSFIELMCVVVGGCNGGCVVVGG